MNVMTMWIMWFILGRMKALIKVIISGEAADGKLIHYLTCSEQLGM